VDHPLHAAVGEELAMVTATKNSVTVTMAWRSVPTPKTIKATSTISAPVSSGAGIEPTAGSAPAS
jgi:hypothetical protein